MANINQLKDAAANAGFFCNVSNKRATPLLHFTFTHFFGQEHCDWGNGDIEEAEEKARELCGIQQEWLRDFGRATQYPGIFDEIRLTTIFTRNQFVYSSSAYSYIAMPDDTAAFFIDWIDKGNGGESWATLAGSDLVVPQKLSSRYIDDFDYYAYIDVNDPLGFSIYPTLIRVAA